MREIQREEKRTEKGEYNKENSWLRASFWYRDERERRIHKEVVRQGGTIVASLITGYIREL